MIPLRTHLTIFAAAISAMSTALPATAAEPAAPKDTKCYEMRTYFAAPGKLDALLARFRNHTVKLFEKHGMTNVGYWLPLENPENKLVYLLSYPDRAARDTAWKAFLSDPEWKKAAAESEKDGRLVAKIEQKFLDPAGFSPEIKSGAANPGRTFELRTYTTTKGNLPRLHERFRDHTMKLFEKHGMTNFGYWSLSAGQPGAEDTLIYLLAHASREAAEASFKAFRSDPVWVAAKAESEKAAGGSLTVENGVKSEFLRPADFSPTK